MKCTQFVSHLLTGIGNTAPGPGLPARLAFESLSLYINMYYANEVPINRSICTHKRGGNKPGQSCMPVRMCECVLAAQWSSLFTRRAVRQRSQRSVRRRGPTTGRSGRARRRRRASLVIDVGKKLSESAKNCEKGERSERVAVVPKRAPPFIPASLRQTDRRATAMFCTSVEGNGVCG